MIYEVITTCQADNDLRGMRVMPIDSYLVFYILDKDAGIVTIIRVMYAGRNIDNQLNNYTIMQKTK